TDAAFRVPADAAFDQVDGVVVFRQCFLSEYVVDKPDGKGTLTVFKHRLDGVKSFLLGGVVVGQGVGVAQHQASEGFGLDFVCAERDVAAHGNPANDGTVDRDFPQEYQQVFSEHIHAEKAVAGGAVAVAPYIHCNAPDGGG